MSNSEKELLQKLSFFSSEMSANMDDYMNSLNFIAENLGAVIHLNKSENLALTFVSNSILEGFDYSLEDIQKNPIEFMVKATNPDTIKYVFPKIYNYLDQQDFSKNLVLFQSYKDNLNSPYTEHYSTMKYNPEHDLFFCIDFNIDRLSPGMEAMKSLISVSQEKEKLFPLFNSLTKREKEILSMIAYGLTNKQIGGRLFVSPNTVRTHRNNIYRKLNIKNLREVIKFAEMFDLKYEE